MNLNLIAHSLRPLKTAAWLGSLIAIASVHSCTTPGITSSERAQQDEVIDVQLGIAANQLNLGHAEKALQTVKPLLPSFPNNYKILTMLGMVHLALSNPDQAVVYLRQAYDESPSISSGLNLSSALISAGEQDRARNVLRKLLKRDERYQYQERLYHNLGLSYHKERNFPAAKKYYNLALRTNPMYYMSVISLAKLYKETGNARAAKEYFAKAVKACPSCYESAHLLATAMVNDSETAAAIAVLKTFAAHPDVTPEDRESSIQLQKVLETTVAASNPGQGPGPATNPRQPSTQPIATERPPVSQF